MGYDATCSQLCVQSRTVPFYIRAKLYDSWIGHCICVHFTLVFVRHSAAKNRPPKFRRLVERFEFTTRVNCTISYFTDSMWQTKRNIWPGITNNVVKCTPSTNKRSNICLLRSKIIHYHKKFVNGSTTRRHRIFERHLAQSDMRHLYSIRALVGVS